MGLDGRNDCGMRRKRWVWKAWLKAFVTSWLQWCPPWSIGVTVHCERTCLWQLLLLPWILYHAWSPSAMLFRHHLIHMRAETKSTILTVEPPSVRLCSTAGSPGILETGQDIQAGNSCFGLRPLQVPWKREIWFPKYNLAWKWDTEFMGSIHRWLQVCGLF